ncbi:MAG: hypothetical protein FPO08_10740 [Geobacter sp.]|nr:MAG: hypothetical protein FPO08_10740 [Geobacter sp.]
MKALLALLLLTLSATAASADIYTWKDNKGTRFYTNSLHEIPAKYLKKARVLDVATGKVGGLATAQPPAPAGPVSPTTARAPLAQPLSTPPPAAAAPPAPAMAQPAVPGPAAASTAAPEPAAPSQVARPQRPSNFAERRAARRARAALE